MMNKLSITTALMCLLLWHSTISWANDSHFIDSRDGTELKSTATATWLAFIEVYDAALYAKPDAVASELLTASLPFSLEIRYKVSLSKDQLIEAAEVALGRQHDDAKLATYQADVDALHQFYQDVEEGDRFRLDITPVAGLALFFNDELRYQNADLAFARYYVGLWLADNPLSDRVRADLLDW